MARELKRKRSASPPPAPTAAQDDDYASDMDDDYAAADTTLGEQRGKVSMARLSLEQGWQCRVCGDHFDFLRYIPQWPGGTWVCNQCMHKLWKEFETKYQKTWEDWDSEWPNFCAFVVQHVRVRPSWQASKS